VNAVFQDGPLDREFWRGDIDARLPAVFRAGLATILLCDALFLFPDISAFYGATGLWPAALGSGPLVGVSDAALRLVWAGGCLSLLALALGWFSRLSAFLSCAFLVAVHHRDPSITTGGDYLAQILLAFCIVLDTGAAFSLDARWRGRARDFVAAAPWRALQLHLAILYFVTARLKIRGGWLSGDGVYFGLQHFGFLRPPGAWLLAHPELCRVSTFVVLALEGTFAFFALSPIKGRTARVCAAACSVAVQLGILLTMRVGFFTALMLWTSVLFLPATARAAVAVTPRDRRLRWALVALCNGVVLVVAWDVFVGRRFPLPAAVRQAQSALGLTQQYDLFGATYEVQQWSARGVRADGREVDVMEATAPGFRSQVGWLFSPFYKVTFSPDADPAAIAQWMCRTYAANENAPLSQVTLAKHARQPARPNMETPFIDTVLFAGPCH